MLPKKDASLLERRGKAHMTSGESRSLLRSRGEQSRKKRANYNLEGSSEGRDRTRKERDTDQGEKSKAL